MIQRPKNKAVSTTSSIMIRSILAGGMGLVVLIYSLTKMGDTGVTGLGRWLMPAVGLFLIALAVILMRDLPAARALDRSGILTQGTVIDKWTRKDSDDDRTCYVAYQYGQGQKAVQTVSWAHYRRLALGDEVEVRYLEADPSRSRMELN